MSHTQVCAFVTMGNLSFTEFGLGASPLWSPSANLSWLVKSDLSNLTLAISTSVGIVLWFTVGVGYRVESITLDTLTLKLGYSHLVVFSLRREVEQGPGQVGISASELSVEGYLV